MYEDLNVECRCLAVSTVEGDMTMCQHEDSCRLRFLRNSSIHTVSSCQREVVVVDHSSTDVRAITLQGQLPWERVRWVHHVAIDNVVVDLRV